MKSSTREAKMPALHDFQSAFRSFLSGAGAPPPGIAEGFADNADIYRNNVRHAHVGALKTHFPAIRILIGNDFFDALAAGYAASNPPTSAVLASYGGGFPAFLEACDDLQRHLFLPDVAQLEWALNEASHAHSPSSLTPEAAARLFADGAADADLQLLPSVRLVSARYPVREIRTAALDGDAQRIAALGPRRQRLLVMRRAGDIVAAELDPGAFALVEALADSAGLDAALSAGLAADPHLSPAEAVGRLLHLGAFAAPLPAEAGV
jgi:hypothetical protein